MTALPVCLPFSPSCGRGVAEPRETAPPPLTALAREPRALRPGGGTCQAGGWRAEGALSELPARSQEGSAKAAGLGRPAAPCGGTAGRVRGEEDQGAERGLDRLWQRGAVARRTRVTAWRHKPRSAGWLGGGDGWGRLPASGGGAGPAEAESRRAQGAREAGGPPRPCPCAGGCWCRRLGTSGAGPPAERASKLFPVGARLSARGPADTASLQSCPERPGSRCRQGD